MTTFTALYDRLDQALHPKDRGTERSLPGKICIELCDLLDLTEPQRAGVDVARRYFDGHASDDQRLKSNELLSREQDTFMHKGDVRSREAAIGRLAWCSLVTTEGLTMEMGEFLLGLAEQAGLSAQQAEAVFNRLVPGFATNA